MMPLTRAQHAARGAFKPPSWRAGTPLFCTKCGLFRCGPAPAESGPPSPAPPCRVPCFSAAPDFFRTQAQHLPAAPHAVRATRPGGFFLFARPFSPVRRHIQLPAHRRPVRRTAAPGARNLSPACPCGPAPAKGGCRSRCLFALGRPCFVRTGAKQPHSGCAAGLWRSAPLCRPVRPPKGFACTAAQKHFSRRGPLPCRCFSALFWGSGAACTAPWRGCPTCSRGTRAARAALRRTRR